MNIVRLRSGLLAVMLVLICGLTVVSQQATADSANLLQNNGFETATSDGTAPLNWASESWGSNNADFSYTSDAHTGVKAVQTTITSYTDGDAKWMPDPVAVTAGSSYTYSDWYKATTSTNIWAQFQNQDGTYQYKFLQAEPNTTSWTSASVSVTIPTTSTSVSIFHVLAGVGQLTVDDTSLSALQADCSPSYVNGLPNGDFEDSCLTSSGLPAGWTPTEYGTTANYTYTTDSYHGNHAVSITNQTDGAEAGYTATVNAPLANQRYNLSFAQKGDTYAYAYLTMGLTDGTTQYQSLMSVPATLGTWSVYSDGFVTPANLQSLQITIATSGSGTITMDDVVLTPLTNQNPVNFTAGMVSLTFDDGDASTYTNGFAALKQYAYKGTFYLNAGNLDTTSYMTSKQVKALVTAGEEIGSHLYHHSDMVQLDTATLQSELSGNIAALQQITGTNLAMSDFASPYGSYTSDKIDTVMQYAHSHRTTDGLLNTKANLNIRQIHAVLVTPNTTLASLKAMVAQAQTQHEWLVLVYHNISSSTVNETGGEAGYTVTPANFKKQLAAIAQTGISVQPVSTALQLLQAQE